MDFIISRVALSFVFEYNGMECSFERSYEIF